MNRSLIVVKSRALSSAMARIFYGRCVAVSTLLKTSHSKKKIYIFTVCLIFFSFAQSPVSSFLGREYECKKIYAKRKLEQRNVRMSDRDSENFIVGGRDTLVPDDGRILIKTNSRRGGEAKVVAKIYSALQASFALLREISRASVAHNI